MKLLAALGLLSVLGNCLWQTANAAPVRQPEPLLLVIESEGENAPEPVLQLQTDGGVIGIDMDEYLSCVVLSELPASFALETMKAQTVAARTYTCRAITHGKHTDADLCDDPACCQAFHTKDKLRERLGEAFDAAWEKATTAVSETEDTILCSGGEPIEAVYYSCSGGRSEDAVAVWGGDVPYLRSVESPGEEFAPRFESEVSVSFSAFCEALRRASDAVSFSVLPQDWIGKSTFTRGGAVETIRLGGAEFRGTQVRKIFSLPSAKFTVSVRGDAVLFSCRGYGHGVGMSQYGAEAMARAGKDWREILEHYYTGVEIRGDED